MYTTIRYTNKKAIEELLTSYCNKLNITDSNYIAITLTLPHLDYEQQEEQLKHIINSIEFPFIGCLEFTDEVNKANGYHYHLVASNEFLEQTKQLEGIHISNNYIGLSYWLNYIATYSVGKQIVKYKPQPQQLELDFNSLANTDKPQDEIDKRRSHENRSADLLASTFTVNTVTPKEEIERYTPATKRSSRTVFKQVATYLHTMLFGVDERLIFDIHPPP